MRASAQTGSGKTAAFVLPLLHRLALAGGNGGVRVLVLVPTRELALQIGEAITAYRSAVKTVVAVGGMSINPQMMALRGGADILVATPGRFLDLLEQNAVQVRALETLVLDEADRMLSLGFATELETVLAHLPSSRQTLLFSATLPKKVLTLADAILRDPVCINVDAGAMASAHLLVQRAIEVDTAARTRLLLHLLTAEAWPCVIVFVASRATADELVTRLPGAAALHGDLSQTARNQALAEFKAGRLRVLVATDVAARGVDVSQLAAVINYDLPRSPTDYLHRLGRTARANAPGVGVSFVTAASAPHFALIEKRNRVVVPRERVPGFEPREITPPANPHGGIKGKRKSKKDKLREAAAKAGGPT